MFPLPARRRTRANDCLAAPVPRRSRNLVCLDLHRSTPGSFGSGCWAWCGCSAPHNLQLGQHFPSQLVLGQHSAYRLVQDVLRMLLPPLGGGFRSQTRVTSEPRVLLAVPFLTGEDDFLRQDHDNEVTRVDMGRVCGGMLPHQNHGNIGGQTPHDLVGSVNQPPFPLVVEFAGLRHVCFRRSQCRTSNPWEIARTDKFSDERTPVQGIRRPCGPAISAKLGGIAPAAPPAAPNNVVRSAASANGGREPTGSYGAHG